MTESPRGPDSDEDAPMPPWVYAAGIVVVILAVAFVVTHLAGGGFPAH
ncbi:MAG TPA: hypothetical protein VGR87_01160 [Candidatus Limnocylindria bacterium]|nr:hypothetical protein [Candidatus Limnocylindria bacterium]